MDGGLSPGDGYWEFIILSTSGTIETSHTGDGGALCNSVVEHLLSMNKA
jgi:hypothetical protein